MVVLYEVMLYEVMLWLYYGCISQERINVLAVPTIPEVFFQPLSQCLAQPGFNEQCTQ